jgi:hypothetical protein
MSHASASCARLGSEREDHHLRTFCNILADSFFNKPLQAHRLTQKYRTELDNCLEMICADFVAGANLDSGQPNVLLSSIERFFKFLPGEQRQAFVAQVTEKAS